MLGHCSLEFVIVRTRHTRPPRELDVARQYRIIYRIVRTVESCGDLLPLDRAGGLGGDVVDDTIHPTDLVDDLVRDLG